MENLNLAQKIVALCEGRAEEIESPASDFEAYSIIKAGLEQAVSAAGSVDKTYKELWTPIKDGNNDATAVYLDELVASARRTATHYAELAAQISAACR